MKKNRIYIFDTTLRDGEQCPGASMTLREKLEVARQLARLKVDVIEGGFPVISEGDFTAVNTIAKEIKGPAIAGLARCVPNDIDIPSVSIVTPWILHWKCLSRDVLLLWHSMLQSRHLHTLLL